MIKTLVVLWAVLLSLGVWTSHAALVASSLVLVVLAWVRYLALRGQAAERYALLLATGMTLGFAGDVCMALDMVMGAIPLFGLGHACYITAMLGLARRLELGGGGNRALIWGGWLAAGLLLWYEIAYLGDTTAAQSPLLLGAGLAYTLLLASTAGTGTGVAARDLGLMPLAIGGALFLVSDAVVATRMFHPSLLEGIFAGSGSGAVWLTYSPAQMLIVSSTFLAAIRPGYPALGASAKGAR